MEDRVIKTNIFERDMSVTKPDGTNISFKGQVIETIWKSGRKDVKVKIPKPFQLTNIASDVNKGE